MVCTTSLTLGIVMTFPQCLGILQYSTPRTLERPKLVSASYTCCRLTAVPNSNERPIPAQWELGTAVCPYSYVHSECPQLQCRFLAVTKLFRIILDVTSPFFRVEDRQWRSCVIDIFYRYFSALWEDDRVSPSS